jgi:dolichol-phosphate mannosyltransferase
MKISVVVPVYGCRGALNALYERLAKVLEQLSDKFEIIFVNDNCPQNSWEVIEAICSRDKRVVGIELSRNYGQIRAITAGLDYSSGDWVVVMDCDLQDRPEEIINLYNKSKEGYDVVFAQRVKRRDNWLKKFVSLMFYKVYNYFSGGNYDESICNFSVSSRTVIDSYCKMREQNRAFVIFLMWMGFKKTAIDVQHDDRAEGKSSYNFKKRIRLAFEIITSQSNKPLIFSINMGMFIAIVALIYIIYLVIHYFFTRQTLVGWTSLIASIYLIGGLLMINIGVLGIYIGNIFNEVKKRPLYLIRTVLNGNKKEIDD